MNMISTGAFLTEMDASNKQPTVAEKFAAVWEKKNAKAARAGGVSLMALSLAACGSSSDDPDPVDSPTDPAAPTGTAETVAISANQIAAKPTVKSDGTNDDALDTLTVRPDVLDDITSITGPFAGLRVLHDGSDATLGNGVTVTNVTELSIEDVNTVDVSFDASQVTALTNWKIEDATSSVTVTDIQDSTDVVKLHDVTGAAEEITLNYDAQQLDDTENVKIELVEVTQGVTITGGTAEQVTLSVNDASANAESTLANLTADGMETLTIGGTSEQDFAITADLEDSITTVDASASLADLTLNMTTADRATATIDLGAGGDQLNLGDTLDEDNISGGAGEDEVDADFTNPGTRKPTMDGVETLDLTFDDSATLDMVNVDDVKTIHIRESDARIALENMDNTVTAINVYELQATNHDIEYDTGEDGNLDLTWTVNDVDDGAIGTMGFDELQSLNWNFAGDEDVTGGNVTFDATDTTDVTVRNTSDGDAQIGNLVDTDAVENLTLSTSDSGTLQVGTMVDAQALDTVIATGAYGNITLGTVGNTTAAGDLDEFTASSTNGSVVSFGNIVGTGATLSFMKLTAEDDGTIDFDTIDAQDIDLIDVSVEEDATVDLAGIVNVTLIEEINVDGEGTFNMDADNTITTVTKIDISGMGDNSASDIDISDTTSAVEILSGEGTHAFELGGGAHTITLVSGDGADSFIADETGMGSIEFTNYQTTDAIDLSVAGFEKEIADLGGTEDLVDIGDLSSSTTTDAVSIANISGATDLDSVADTVNVLHVGGNHASAAAMVDELESGGDYELTFDGALTAATDLFLVVWDDGTDSYLSAVSSGANISDSATANVGDLSATNFITFNGIADADDITAAMLGTTFLA